MRVIQPQGKRGSSRWIQIAVEKRPDLLQPQDLDSIKWVSPLADDDFAEYRDSAFLERLGLDFLSSSLKNFWPSRGPQWDALGTTSNGPVLVEAKAHIREFHSPPSQAGLKSITQIEGAFKKVRADLGVASSGDWTKLYYQFANRLAFLWWLRSNGVDAKLLFVSFLNDQDMGGPKHPETWEAAFTAANYALGLAERHKLSRHIYHVTPNVLDLL